MVLTTPVVATLVFTTLILLALRFVITRVSGALGLRLPEGYYDKFQETRLESLKRKLPLRSK